MGLHDIDMVKNLSTEALTRLARALQLEISAAAMAELPPEKQAILNKKLARVPDQGGEANDD